MFNNRSRLMLIAAHPDDESLACGVALQRAVGVGADIRVIYATDGENNPWPQRVMERKWRLNEGDRAAWGKLRRAEALAALAVLGLPESAAVFLGLPDQKLSEALILDSGGALERLAALITDWAPTHLLVPSISDLHPDHNALGVMLRLLWAEYFPDQPNASMWSYVVHGRSAAFLDRAETIEPTAFETAAKVRAISCHKTQLKLSRKRFLAHAEQPERLVALGRGETIDADGAITSISRDPHWLRIKLERSLKLIRSRNATLFVLGRDQSGRVRCVRSDVPLRRSRIGFVEVRTNEPIAGAHYDGDASGGTLAIPLGAFSPNGTLFVKLEQRGWFFDEAGWLELPPPVGAERTTVTEKFFAGAKVSELTALRH